MRETRERERETQKINVTNSSTLIDQSFELEPVTLKQLLILIDLLTTQYNINLLNHNPLRFVRKQRAARRKIQ